MVRLIRTRMHTLRDAVIARRMLWALCLGCGHTKRFDPKSLAFAHGDLDFVEIEPRLKCRRCGARGRALVAPDDREWTGR